MESIKFSFEINAVWSEDKMVKISSATLPDAIETVIPPPYQSGIAGHWSSQHLFLGAVLSSYAHTIQHLSRTSELPFNGFSAQIIGDAEVKDRVFGIHHLQLVGTLNIPLETYRVKAEAVLEKAKDNCPIINSIKTTVVIDTKIIVNELVDALELIPPQ